MQETKPIEVSGSLKHEGSPKCVEVLQQWKLPSVRRLGELVGLEHKDGGLYHERDESLSGLHWCFLNILQTPLDGHQSAKLQILV